MVVELVASYALHVLLTVASLFENQAAEVLG